MISAPSPISLQFLDVLELDAVVEARPQPPEQQRHERDEGLRIVGRDLDRVLARRQQRARRARHSARASHFARARHGAPPARFARCARPWCAGATDPGRWSRRAARAAPRAAMRSSRRTPRCGGRSRLHRLAQPQRLAEIHDGVAAVDEHVEELAEAPHQHPVLGEQQPPQALSFSGARPQKIATGIRSTSTSGSASAAVDQLHQKTRGPQAARQRRSKPGPGADAQRASTAPARAGEARRTHCREPRDRYGFRARARSTPAAGALQWPPPRRPA